MVQPDDRAALEAALQVALASPDAGVEFDRFQTRLFAEDDTVRSGPFRGMRLIGEESWGHIANYLLGAYERELHPVLEQMLDTGYDTVVDVGCAEGYYAVGLALRLPMATVHAFDIDERSQQICARTAAANGVADRVVVSGVCDGPQLQQLITARSLVFVDCEGCEAHLLDPNLVPALGRADLIVELHDFIDPTITGTVLDRFTATHDIELVDLVDPSAEDYPDLAPESGLVKFTALYEARPTDPHPMQWAILRARRR